MHDLIDDFKVLGVTVAGIVTSYIITDPLSFMRWIVLLATLCFTLRRWWIMEKRNKDKN